MKPTSLRKSPDLQGSTLTSRARERHLSLRDRAYDAIKDRIITCKFKPGQTIDEITVAQLLGFGRTPVHQALGRLHFEGLVDVKPRKGVVVTPVILPEVLQIVEARIINESQCARLAAERADKKDIEAMVAVTRRAELAIKNRDVKSMMRHDREFHLSLVKGCKNEILGRIVDNLNERSLRFWFISFTSDHHSKFQEQHESIVDAIRAHDGDAADNAMRLHLEMFRMSVARYIERDT